ncbi:MAG: 2-isopropylmalate synthase [Christensenellaceae bacterium]|jgi:2-isopropylmalate synthase|nr:2-isopropylmalate synthase [Christensenellaceae bacterium]
MEKNNRLIVFDTTLRDGEQTPGVNLNLQEKIEIAKQLEALGVDVIEAGFPASSNGDFEAVQGVAQSVSCSVAALCRCVISDIERGWEAVKNSKKPRIHVFIATSEIHMKYKLKMKQDDVFKQAVDCVRFAKSLCDDVEFSCEDASRSEPEFLYKILTAVIDAGASTVNIPDTVGYKITNEFGEFIAGIKRNVPNIEKAVISVHCHNDLGLAVANTIVALQNGARQIETTINGIGERAGNCSMEEVIMAITTRKDILHIPHNIDTTAIYRTAKRVSKLTGVPIPICKPIVGDNAFAHESGVHQHGVLANPLTYEIMTPESVGKTESTLVLGKLSGRHAFAAHIKTLNYELDKNGLESAFLRFKDLADKKKKITDDDIEALISNRTQDVRETYRLESFQLQTGNKIKSLAGITLSYKDNEYTETAVGDGPVNAAYNAITKIIGGEWPLSAYEIKAVTEGRDALGEVTVRIKKYDRIFVGKGVSHDVIAASILAYINAVNRAEESQR